MYNRYLVKKGYMLKKDLIIIAEVPISACPEDEINEITKICKERSDYQDLEGKCKYWPKLDFCRFNGWPST